VSGAALRSWLPARRIPALWRETAAHALATPWCWPADPALAADAVALGYAPPAPASLGEVLLVSVAPRADRTTLWRLSWDGRHHVGGRSFSDDAQRAIDDVATLGPAVVPHLHSLRVLGQKPRTATQVLKRGPDADSTLEGTSFGLSMLLALSSRLMDRPVPARFAASAEVRRDGSVVPVGGIDRKLALLSEGALGVDAVLVAAEQLVEAQRILGGHPWLRAVGVATVREAIDHVFPDAREAPPAAWTERRPIAAVNDLLTLCSRGGDVRSWRAVERSATWLERIFAGVHPHGDRARLARLIAERHANGHGFELPWEASIETKHDRTQAAHVVQAAADAGSRSLGPFIGRAREMLSDPWDDEDLRLIGAIGRGLAAMRRYPEAGAVLAKATRGWFDRENLGECSRPLAEWVRVASLCADGAAWDDAAPAAHDYLASLAREDMGALFVRYALGRGLCTRGAMGEALAVLDGADWSAGPSWLARSRGRWRARALHALGRAEEARAGRAVIAAATDDDGATTIEARFVALDEAREADGDLGAAVAAVRGAAPQGVGWLWDEALTSAEQARRLADEYPY
jgi:hypothetical protein